MDDKARKIIERLQDDIADIQREIFYIQEKEENGTEIFDNLEGAYQFLNKANDALDEVRFFEPIVYEEE